MIALVGGRRLVLLIIVGELRTLPVYPWKLDYLRWEATTELLSVLICCCLMFSSSQFTPMSSIGRKVSSDRLFDASCVELTSISVPNP
eukprot:901459-Amphidinium_carterae.1